MTTLDDLYVHYCRRCGCKANSKLRKELSDAYEANGGVRQLDVIDISANYVGPKGLQPVMMLLANLESVSRLDASNNMLTHDSLESLVEVAASHRGLREIALANNAFHDSSAYLLLHLLQTNWRITDLNVSGNDLTSNTLNKIEQQLVSNRQAVAAAMASDELLTAERKAVLLEREKSRYTPWSSTVNVAAGEHQSGGSLHFASWRRNPQVHLFLSHGGPVTISLKVIDPLPTRLVGFVVLQGGSPLSVVDVTTNPSVVVAESVFNDAAVTLTVRLDACPRASLRPYVIMPLTFQPRKAFACSITASLPSDTEGAHVKLEPISARGDWFTHHVTSEWAAGSAGGSLAHPSWRRNLMYRLRPQGVPTYGKARLAFVLSKAVDDDDNDDREIGVDLLAPDARGRRPIRAGAAYPGSVLAAHDHRRAATIVYNFETTCDAKSLDLFVMPSTALPHQEGRYELSIYSTVELEVEESPYGHGWHTQRLQGAAWDASRSGGSRAENPTTWVHNPCYELQVVGDAPVDVQFQLEATLEGGSAATSSSSSSRRGGTAADVGVLLLQADDNLTPVAQAPWVAASACTWADLWVTSLDPGRYYVVPATRLAGVLGRFELEVTASRAVHLSLETPLHVRLRQRQLQRYDEETAARTAAAQRAAQDDATTSSSTSGGAAVPSPHGSSASGGTAAASVQVGPTPADLAEAAAVRADAMAAYHKTGAAFVDRDFPRGASSLWKNAIERPTLGSHPNVHAWRRPDEFMAVPRIPRADEELGVVPQGYDVAWLHSALACVVTRPLWLKNLIVAAQPGYGLYQFRFFKNGAWRTVTVDDYLPVDAAGELCFSTPLLAGSVLGPMAEKAYAKLHRSYEALDATTASPIDEADLAAKADPASPNCDAGYTLLSRALMDFTGGIAFERRLYDTEGKKWVLNGMWAHLRTCRDESRVVALRLSPATPRAMEKKELGVFLDRLYPVLDARDVEGVKLVKLRNFWGWGTQDSGSAKEWTGKWRAGSANWTPTIRKAVQFDPEDATSFWLSAEEVAYFFGVVHTIDCRHQRAWVHGGFASNVRGGDLQSEGWTNNPQYALRVETDEPIDVLIGLHQPDALMTLTRDDTARVEYRAALGVTTVRTGDDGRKLMAITDTEVPFNGPVAARRDAFYTVRYDPRSRYIVMPFNTTPVIEAAYSISVSCPRPVTLAQIGGDLSVRVDGAWTTETAGGPPSAATWRDNPQFLIYASEATTATIILRQRNDLASTTNAIGFSVIAARDVRRAMNYGDCDVVAEAKHNNAHAVTANVKLTGTKDRLGMPYLVVPSTAVAGAATGFTLEIVCNVRVSIKPIDQEIDYRRHVVTGAMSFEDGNAGGAIEHSSWRCNPQFAVTFPVAKTGRLVVSFAKRRPSDDQEIVLYCLKADAWDLGRRRKLQLQRADILKVSPATTATATDLAIDFVDAREPFIIMPATTMPFSECPFQLSFYATCDLSVRPVDEWHAHDAAGAWNLGTTAGGARDRHRSWINNPFFGLNVTRPTRVTIVAIQYPRGPEKPVVRRVGKNRILVPPPIVNDHSKVCFGFDVCESTGAADVMKRYEIMQSTKLTYEAEVAMTLRLEACATEPYYVVPHTFDAEQEADFRVFVYADEPVQFGPLEKPRATYV